jgi:DNA primase
MPSIPENFIDDLLARVDLHDLLGRYITLKKTGSRYMGVCPFHGDSNPSLSVTPDKGFWYCFGCQAGGDAISFIRKQENLDFVEAVRFIAGLYGIAVPEGVSDPHAGRRRTLIDINDRARDFFIKIMKSKHGRPFREYLRDRGFKRETIEAFRLGAGVPGWENLSRY